MSVIVKEDDEAVLVTKGALEEMLSISTHVKDGDVVHPITDEFAQSILEAVSGLKRTRASRSWCEPKEISRYSPRLHG